MTAPPPGPRTGLPPASRTRALTLAAALLLAVSGLLALPEAFFSEAYYTNTWATAAFAAPLLTVTTLVLAAAAVARGSRTFLLAVSVGALLLLVGLFRLGLLASGGVPSRDGPRLWSGPAQLGLALLALALGWWITERTERRPWVPLLLLTLAPLLGRFTSTSPYWDWSWWPVLVAALGLPAALTILAAGLVCLPDRGPQVAGAVLIVLAGLGVHGSDLVLGRAPHPYQLVVMGLAFGCVVTGILARPRHAADAAEAPSAPEDAAQTDDGAPTASTPEPDREVTAMSDAAVVVVPSSQAEGDTSAETERAGAPGRALSVAALVVLVLTVALEVPEMFAHGPGIQPDRAGLAWLVDILGGECLQAALTLTAGAAILRSRGVLVVASVLSGLLALALLASRTATYSAVTLPDALPFVALGLALAFAWADRARPGAGGAALRWAAAVPPWVTVVPLALVASPLMMLVSPGAMAYVSAPVFLTGFLAPGLLPEAGPVVAAALLAFPRRATRTAASVLLCLVAVGGVVALLLEGASGLRVLAGLQLLQIAGYGLACVLVLASVLAPGRPRKPTPTSARWAPAG